MVDFLVAIYFVFTLGFLPLYLLTPLFFIKKKVDIIDKD